MKLEPKHLAPYLPYEMVFVIDMYKFTEGNCKPEIRQFTMGNDLSMCLNYGTPILFPLSKYYSEKNGYGGYIAFKDFKNEVINKRISLKVYENLLENKFDVFGLIDSGLAEAVTKDFNPYK